MNNMDKEKLLTFQKFSDQELALELVEFLKENKIESVIEDSTKFGNPYCAASA